MAYDGTSDIPGPTIREIATANLGIRASCACGHSRTLKPASICIPPTANIETVGSLLKCSKCGTKGLVTIVAPLKD